MKNHWYAFGFLGLILFVLSSCGAPPAQPPGAGSESPVQEAARKAEEAAKEKARKATTMGINPDILPKPRQRLADSPDLSNAKFVINDATLRKMANAGVPADVIKGVNGLQGRTFDNARAFREALNESIGAANTDAHGRTIMLAAAVVELADAELAPQSTTYLVPAGAQPAGMGSDLFEPVYFDYDKSTIKPEFRRIIASNAEALKADGSLRIIVEGLCDNRGTTEYNLALGERRARAVRSALIDEGISSRRMRVLSLGEELAAQGIQSEAAYAKDRRSVLTIEQ